MTVQAGIELDLDIAVLVGEMPVVPCEHGGHQVGHPWHDKGPATHYLHGSCECGRDTVFAACNAFVHVTLADTELSCGDCGRIRPATHFLTILGPITK